MSDRLTDIRVLSYELYLLPIETRVPLKFGNATVVSVTCARVKATVETRDGRTVEGWGETPLSVQWVWPSAVPYSEREDALIRFTERLSRTYALHDDAPLWGHPLELGVYALENQLPELVTEFNASQDAGKEALPHLGALVCASPFDIAVHDAYGIANGIPVYQSYNAEYMNADLSRYLPPDEVADFTDAYPEDFLVTPPDATVRAWHLVGGKDPVLPEDLDGSEPEDGYPVLLADWIDRDGLRCLKVKLTGNDADWDYRRLVAVGRVGIAGGVEWLSADFNCQVTEPGYVNEILDHLRDSEPRIYGMILYVEQPFPYDLEANPVDVHSVSARKPLFMDESAHDWRVVRRGYELGWTGVALKTCKTQTGALLSLCWARSHGMTIMVQDLTNPMLAQIPHIQLGYYAGTIMGVETNGMQFYPEASKPEETVHPGLYRRTNGNVYLTSCLNRPGFGYRVEEISRALPSPIEGDSRHSAKKEQ